MESLVIQPKNDIMKLGDNMLKIALKLIKTIEDHGYVAYIVGGFVRDQLLGVVSNDVDICTNARPSDIRNIFPNSCLPDEAYGSITVMIRNIRFEITTFRREIRYLNNRKPVEFEYIDDLLEDLKRRDFRINTICMDKHGKIIDLLHGREDLQKREIHTVGNSIYQFSQDALRILRAIRFATNLSFSLSSDIKQAILETKHYVRNLSYDRKKEELNKIFASIHVRYGIKLLLELGLDKELQLSHLKEITNFDDLIGIWTQLYVEDIYPFSKNEKELMQQIREVLAMDILDPVTLYRYGLYVNSVAASIQGISKKLVIQKYNELPIKGRSDIVVNGKDIMDLLKTKPGKYLKDILLDIEEKIVRKELENDSSVLKKYIVSQYGDLKNS